MPRRTPGRTLANLRKSARRWLKELRANDPEARARLERAHPGATAEPTLRDVQHALARELGFPGWADLRKSLAERESISEELDVVVARFLDNACPDHHVRGRPDHVRALHTAVRLLDHNPAIARASFATAVVCGDVGRVERLLLDQPRLASTRETTPGEGRSGAGNSGDLVRLDLGPKGWEPLLYLCFTRLPLTAANDNAVAIAELLLDHGADPNAFFMAGDSRYTPLVGAIGEGEEDRPPHPRRDELVRLLLERGAEPYDLQVVYDIHFQGDVLWFLERMYETALRLGRRSDWDDPAWSMLDMGAYGDGARWHLDLAVKRDDVALAEWCLAHGASPNAPPASDPRLPQRSLYEEAVRLGHRRIAELLVERGAQPTAVVVQGLDALVAACLRPDWKEVERALSGHAEYLSRPEPLFRAAERDRADVVERLLDLGVSPEVQNDTGERALHRAAYRGALRVASLLIARGAEIDPVESSWHNTPLGVAVYRGHETMIELLAHHSRDVWRLTYAGKLDRLRIVLHEEPERARAVADGHTPLMWLPPHDEAVAMDIADLLLRHGADPSLRDRDGMTAADRAEHLGMFEVADTLRAAKRERRDAR